MLQPACTNLFSVRRQKQKHAAYPAVMSPFYIYLPSEYYAKWTRFLQSVSLSLPLLLLTWQKQQLLIIHSAVMVQLSLPLFSSLLFPLHQPVQSRGQSADFIYWFLFINQAFFIFSILYISSSILASLPFFLLPEHTICLFAKQLLPVS